jgi:hypothetical protein
MPNSYKPNQQAMDLDLQKTAALMLQESPLLRIHILHRSTYLRYHKIANRVRFQCQN